MGGVCWHRRWGMACDASDETVRQTVRDVFCTLRRNVTQNDTQIRQLGRDYQLFLDKKYPGCSDGREHTTLPVHERWRAMLKEGTFGDVVIVCVDGEEIQAHTCVLAHASYYFRRLFEGPWNKETVHVDVPAEAMHGLLSFLYLDEIDAELISRYPADFLRLSQQYLLPELEARVDAQLAREVDIDHLQELLILSELHSATQLERACLDLVCSNKATTLSRMIHLATTHPDLWRKVVEVASSDEPVKTKKRKKKTRNA